jgi:cytochrome c
MYVTMAKFDLGSKLAEMQSMIRLDCKCSRIITFVILLGSASAIAQPDTRRGFSLAREHCAECHAIDNAGASPLATAPPFRELHLKYAISDLQRPLTQGPHTRFHLEPSQIEALMAYLKTLDRQGQ